MQKAYVPAANKTNKEQLSYNALRREQRLAREAKEAGEAGNEPEAGPSGTQAAGQYQSLSLFLNIFI